MADRLRCVAVAAVAATLLALPAAAPAATGKPTCRSAATVKHAKARKGKLARRCRARAERAGPRGTDSEHSAPAAIDDDGRATRAGEVLEV
jgi:hypothetical protein